MRQFSRREFIAAASSASGALALGCKLDTVAPTGFTQEQATLTARPSTPTKTPTTGYTALGLTTPRDGLLYVPSTYNAATPAPLLVLLHDGSSGAQYWEDTGVGALLDDLGVVILAPDSRYNNWDLYQVNGFREDVAFLNGALTYAFQNCNINPGRIALGGFGYGATEGIGIGFANGNLFTHVIACSPYALFAPFVVGKPKVMVTHGTADPAFPFDYTKNNIVPKMQEAGYTVNFVQYDDVHVLPPAIMRQAAEWFLA